MRNGPIVLVDDDIDDHEIMKEVLNELGATNQVCCFDNCAEAFRYLKKQPQSPFFILCDINLPVQSGVDFKGQIDEDVQLRRKSIPFIFYSTFADQKTVNDAYRTKTLQGFFRKASDYEEIKKDMQLIIGYWSLCIHPDT
jgi:response regulator RpfG family c-di-GMP phosphodiesterase